MKKISVFFSFLFINLFFLVNSGFNHHNKKNNDLILGIDNFEEYEEIFEGKRIGLITNPTGIRKDYESSIDFLFRTVNLVALYAPEHGIRGDSREGAKIDEDIDIKTNLTIYSLYGKNLHPTEKMLNVIDIMTIDIQDVGARYYTYIYTMAYAMESCKKYNKTFVVFDRPNPVGGELVDGNILELKYKTFTGLYPIVGRHGMTIGELALMFNEEFGIGCDLKIVKMKNYDRHLFSNDYNVPWINPSPNIPTVLSAVLYGGTGLFEGTNIAMGRGTTKPFEYVGAPFIDPFEYADKLNKLQLPGVYFRPVYFTPVLHNWANKQCSGVQVHIINKYEFLNYKTGLAMIYTLKEMYGDKVFFTTGLKSMTGTDYIYNMRYSLDELFYKINLDIIKFKETRKKYLLY